MSDVNMSEQTRAAAEKAKTALSALHAPPTYFNAHWGERGTTPNTGALHCCAVRLLNLQA